MSESVNLPALGESVTEGTVTRWLKNVGDTVEVDEPLLEVSTDKVDTEIPSPVAGVVEEILVAEDETVEVGTPLVRIGDGSGGGDAPAADAPAEAEPEAESNDSAPVEAQEGSSSDDPAVSTDDAPVDEVPSTDAEAAPASSEDNSAPAPAEAADPAPAQKDEPAPAPAAAAEPVTAQPVASSSPAPATPGTSAEDAPAASAPAAQPAAPAPAAPAPATPAGSNAGYVTPLVRKLANELGVDLASVSGTGVGGRIRKEDVVAASTPAEAPTAAPAAASAAPLETSPLRGTTVPMSRLRKVIAERAVASMGASAQLTSVVEVDVTKVAAFRDRVKGSFQEKAGVKLSFLPFFALAASEALKAFPVINATIEDGSIVYPPHENLSIAVDTERGLLTPVIRDASSLSLAEFAQQIADLATRTRDNKLKPDELAGGTFTLTNTGSRGALFDTPIVFLPQSAILGTGIVAKKAVVVSQDGTDAIAIRSMVYLALSYDHRIVDGADAARFLVAVKNRLEAGDFEGNLGV
ncbi:2-oxoglutarate dehydrogenase, E2 component, dihydrolipoamide succinyltransferase [Marisediminicola sp. LYQ134]|uniref:2-oxoglutarate dehydrogenase, E2 component, dihydrolipoamide succinyltransferase n=1 Tax=unclassified Marisediminicola TaxID=2618316 RepID=UPI003983B07B